MVSPSKYRSKPGWSLRCSFFPLAVWRSLWASLPIALGVLGTIFLTPSPALSQPQIAADTSAPYLRDAKARGAVLGLVDAATLPGTLKIDGDLGEWGDAAAFGRRAALIHQGLFVAANAGYLWQDAPDIQGASMARSYDAAGVCVATAGDALYLAARVVDNAVVPAAKSDDVESGDCLALMLDFRSFEGQNNQRFATWNPWEARDLEGMFTVVVGLNEAGDGAARIGNTALGRSIAGVEGAARRRDFGYDIEIKIPLSSLSLNQDMAGHVTPERLKPLFGIGLAVCDRDDAKSGAPISISNWTLGKDGSPWGVVIPATELNADEERAAPALLATLLSPPRLESGRRFWRGGAWFSLADLPPAPTLSVDLQTSPLNTPFVPLIWQRRETPFEARNLAAHEAKTSLEDVQIDRYPALGVALIRRDLDIETLPYGPLSLSLKVGGQAQVRAYFWSAYSLAELSPKDLQEAPDPAGARRALQNAWWGDQEDSAFLVQGETMRGAMIPWFNNRGPDELAVAKVWGEDGWKVEADLVVRRAKVNPDASVAPDGDPVWRTTVPIRPTGFDFAVPTPDLSRGPYILTWSAFEVSDGKRTPLPIASGDNKQVLIVVSGPRERLMSATVSDAPQLLHGAQLIGSPFRVKFARGDGDDNMARGIQDLQLFKGRIYAGGGDWEKNRGPVEIWSFAPGEEEEKSWKNEGSFQEECFERFRVLDDDGESVLTAPGIDPEEDWNFGNVYFKRRNTAQKDSQAPDAWKWEKKRTIPNGVINFDVAKWDDKLWVTNSTDKGTRLQSSQDFGQTWQIATDWNRDARLYPGEMAPLSNGLFLALREAQRGALWQDKTGIHPLFTDLFPLLPGVPLRETPRREIQRLTPFATPENPDGLLYCSKWGAHAPLCYLPSPQSEGALCVEPFAKATVSDIVVRDGTVYILTGEPNPTEVKRAHADDTAFGAWVNWDGAVYASHDLKTWTRYATFQTQAQPFSLEVVPSTDAKGKPADGTPIAFYVGLAAPDYNAHSLASGDVLRLVP